MKLGADKLALLSAKAAQYYGVDGPGARIWELLQTETTRGATCDVLGREYDVDPEVCVSDTSAFVAEPVSEGLVRMVDV